MAQEETFYISFSVVTERGNVVSELLTEESLARACRKLNFPLSEEACHGLKEYLDLLMRWNGVMNLVGTGSWQETLETLIIDSFYLADFLETLLLSHIPSCHVLATV